MLRSSFKMTLTGSTRSASRRLLSTNSLFKSVNNVFVRSFSDFDTKSKKTILIPSKKVSKPSISENGGSFQSIGAPKPTKTMYNLKIKLPQWALASFYAMDRPILGMENFTEIKPTKTKKKASVLTSSTLYNSNIPKEAALPELIRLGPFAESIIGSYEKNNSKREAALDNIQDNLDNQQDYVDLFLDTIEHSINNLGSMSRRRAKTLYRRLSPYSRYTTYLNQQALDLNVGVSKNNSPMHLTSVLRKKKLKMNKHKRRKLRKRNKSLRKSLGK
ncbi:hypothetical protein BB561_002676 [Smittium simulii]|uniref:Small ribosomal subunit protein mS38 n=1 Tax=Smittium simulii TaxID=133385 RepID=A0A2T9YPJ6_9FUNG|nr:hypothetical protein BB561_002676 [Smittium simulii]